MPVETRKAKAARLARDVAERKTGTQAQRAHLIRLPVEIRLMICQGVWIPTLMPWEYDPEAPCRGEPIIEHMKQLHVLTSVCRHLRYEVISEYFNRAQAHVTHCVGGFRIASDVRVLAAMRYIKVSSLFTNHLRQIRLTWLSDTLRGWLHWGSHMGKWVSPLYGLIPMEIKQPGKELRQVNTLRWLTNLKSLQTLEIGFMDVLPGLHGEPMFFGRNTMEWRELLKLRKLESISFRLYSARRREEFTKNWENSEGFLQYKRVLAEHLLKYPVVAEEKQRKPCRIDVHIGTVRSEDHPLS